MNISKTNSINFKSSILNITSLADNHGDILGIPNTITAIEENKEDLFEKKKNSKNVLAIVGDFFMNPEKKGFLTYKNITSGDIQYKMLEKLVEKVKKINKRIEIFYEPGNHCFGAGEDWLFSKLQTLKMKTLITNIDRKNTPSLEKFNKESFIDEKIIEIPDDKNPKRKNKVLFLGITVPSRYFNVESLKNIRFYDDTTKSDIDMNENDLKETIKIIDEKVKNFKKENNNGAVVLLAHTGNKLSTIIAKKVKNINLILNAHDHKDFTTMVDNTLIVSHGQNNKFIRLSQLKFDDDGKLEYIKEQKTETAPYIKKARKNESLQYIITKYLKEDLKPIIYFKENIKEQDLINFDNSIRYKNNMLANFITTAIKKALLKDFPQLVAVGIPSTIIRNSLKSNPERTTFNNIDLMNMFSGIDEKVSALRIGTIRGFELVDLIVENVRNNLKSPTRNALIQWSDIQINKNLIEKIETGKSKKNYKDAIKIKNQKTGVYEKITSENFYCIMLPDKYLIKENENIKMSAQIRGKFININEKYEDLFRKYLEMQNNEIRITSEIKEKRII